MTGMMAAGGLVMALQSPNPERPGTRAAAPVV
jgi:hypothetical protein